MTDQTSPTLSAEAADRLREELHELRTDKMPAADADIDDSRSAGDIAENPDFLVALEHKKRLEGRAAYIENLLDTATIFDADRPDTETNGEHGAAQPGGQDGPPAQPCAKDRTARPGNHVTVDWGDGDTETFLLGTIEERPGGDITVVTSASPVGKALHGARCGERCDVTTPNGTLTITIVDIA